MSNFFDEQGRTMVCSEAYIWYAAGGNLRRTPLIGKRAISVWKLFAIERPIVMQIFNLDITFFCFQILFHITFGVF
jgi:hypothetical protein